MAHALAFRCADDPKDFSVWDAHKDTLRRLYLTEGKTLANVKATMMAEFGFPDIKQVKSPALQVIF